MASGRPFNWEAALVPFWGWLRSVPFARGLSLPFPFLVLFVLVGSERTLSWWDVWFVYAAVNAAYGVLYGFAGDWMLRRAHPDPKKRRPITVGGLIVYFIGSGLLFIIGLMLVVFATSSAPLKAYTSNMKADLRNVMAAQDDHFAKYGRYATSLDSLIGLETSEYVAVTLLRAENLSWSAEAEFRGQSFRCRVYVDRSLTAPADSLNGEPTCDPLPGLR